MATTQGDIGALARIGAAQLQAAFELAREHRVYDLGLELGEHIPQGPPGEFVPFTMTTRRTPQGTGASGPFQYSAEAVNGMLHVGTHIDAFIHVQAEGRCYGGERADELRDDSGWKRFGIETVPPIVGRAVLLDVAGRKGLDALPDGYEVTIEDLEDALMAADATLREGDVVLVRTGKIREYYLDARAFQAGQPGVGPEAAVWLYEQGMAVLGTDTTGTEPLPFEDSHRAANSTHRAMLVERGVHLIENLFLDELARDAAAESLFICLALKIKGATGSWVRPIAVV